jgi:hypothetical protein
MNIERFVKAAYAEYQAACQTPDATFDAQPPKQPSKAEYWDEYQEELKTWEHKRVSAFNVHKKHTQLVEQALNNLLSAIPGAGIFFRLEDGRILSKVFDQKARVFKLQIK